MTKPNLEFEDIQGFALRGFGFLADAGYAMVSIKAPGKFKAWLAKELGENKITPSVKRKITEGQHHAIAFTANGLKKLLGENLMAGSFPIDFIEGMVQEHRSRLLGDTHANAPSKWRWGKDQKIDAIIMAFAPTRKEVEHSLTQMVNAQNGMVEVVRVHAQIPADKKEPFGFTDGLSQPIIKGTKRDKDLANQNSREYKLNSVAAGEFILGYPDGTGNLPRTPAVGANVDTQGLLACHPEQSELKDFGRNGSYLVVRQLAQDVEAFEQYISQNQQDGFNLAEKMVGRTKSGKTITQDSRSRSGNDYDYLEDLDGKHCPIGSHVRRTNPRSTVHDASEEGSLQVSNRHRIIRRGRVYKQEDGETGLLFLCMNARISRQFEFIQSTWCNDPFFQGLSGEVDPLIGTQRLDASYYTIPQAPYRCKVDGLQQWITVKGGAYFFVPGLNALRVLSQ